MRFATSLLVLLTLVTAVTACGRRGDPETPGIEQPEPAQATPQAE